MARQYDRVKLHVTLMNTLMRKDPSGASLPAKSDRRQHRDRESFNAVGVLKVSTLCYFGLNLTEKTRKFEVAKCCLVS